MKPFLKMTEDELMAFWSRYHRASRKDAAELCGGKFPGYIGAAASVANYACNLAVAKACRRRGDKAAAKIYDHAARISADSVPLHVRSHCRL